MVEKEKFYESVQCVSLVTDMHCRWFRMTFDKNTRSVRKVSDRIFLCEHLMDYNLARLREPTLNLSAHA